VATFRLNFADDVLCLSRLLDVERERVGNLAQYQYLVRDMNTGQTVQQATGAAPELASTAASGGGRSRKK
jgi:hypothetical protein